MAEGVSGYMVPREDEAAFADKVKALLCDDELRWRFGRAGREHAGEHFGLDRLLRDTDRLIAPCCLSQR